MRLFLSEDGQRWFAIKADGDVVSGFSAGGAFLAMPGRPAQAEFLLVYDANGGNATAAYLATHPGCQSRNAARVNGLKMLRNARVAAAQTRLRQERLARLGMNADEVDAGPYRRLDPTFANRRLACFSAVVLA